MVVLCIQNFYFPKFQFFHTLYSRNFKILINLIFLNSTQFGKYEIFKNVFNCASNLFITFIC